MPSISSVRDSYEFLAGTYDEVPNPMLSLEQRYLEGLLPPVAGRDVVDLGCGTGRWLKHIAQLRPRSLTGVDFSSGMLARAATKTPGVRLINADVQQLPLPDESVDIVLGSFLLGYLRNLDAVAREARRIVRPDGHVTVSDLHPETSRRFGWKRGFPSREGDVTLDSEAHDLDTVVQSFREAGLELTCLVEPRFGAPEELIFETAGRDDFDKVCGFPSIYIAGFRLNRSTVADSYSLRGARVAIGAHDSCLLDVGVEDESIEHIGRSVCLPSRGHTTDLSGYLLLPGLINAHDHLEFALFPRLGHGPYGNATQWAHDIQASHADLIQLHRRVPRQTRLWWGGLRNAFAGVTTVCHHNRFEAEVFTSDFPLSVVDDLTWAHSLQFDDAFARQEETGPDQPFIIHLAEGVDEESASEFRRFERLLDGRSVIVHGLNLSDADIDVMNGAGASLIWCPTSNEFLFGRTINWHRLRELKNVALGTDSSLTASGGLIDEIGSAVTSGELEPQEIYRLVTGAPSRILRLRNGEGRIAIGGVADFMAVRDRGLGPAETLCGMTHEDVELVISRGRIIVASQSMIERLSPTNQLGLAPIEYGGLLRWVRAPLGVLFSRAEAVLGCEFSLGGKRVANVSSAWL